MHTSLILRLMEAGHLNVGFKGNKAIAIGNFFFLSYGFRCYFFVNLFIFFPLTLKDMKNAELTIFQI